MPDNKDRKLLSYVGFAARSRGVAIGTEQTLIAVRKNPEGVAVTVAKDASDRTKKQLRDKCSFYKAALFEPDVTSEELAKILGKLSVVSAAAITDKNLAKAAKALFSDNEEQ
ncbi:MAG: hypothetical protein E7660_05925 [Ruminococcaceae bacterium]|nr:hypothetical protein [Oscillospiraceae bacterium]